MRLRCSKCKVVVKYNEKVYLDQLNTVTHQRCGTGSFDVKDAGSFYEIVNKYDFFHELIPPLRVIK